MSVRITLDNAINDLRSTLRNDFVMQNIVAQLVNKINGSGIINPEYKSAINEYFNLPKPYVIRPISMALTKPIPDKKSGEPVSIKNILISTAIYYLLDLNLYDYHLINYSFNYGLKPNDIIVLLLLNNIYDIEIFCKQKGLLGDKYHSLATLKKLSALWKVQYNF
jgi:hypothetical protein